MDNAPAESKFFKYPSKITIDRAAPKSIVIRANTIIKKKIISIVKNDFKRRCNCKKKRSQRTAPSTIKCIVEFFPDKNKQETK